MRLAFAVGRVGCSLDVGAGLDVRSPSDDEESGRDVAYVRLLPLDESELLATAHMSRLDPCTVRRVTVVGSATMAVCNDLSPEDPVRVYERRGVRAGEEPSLPHPLMSYHHGDIESPLAPFEEPLQVQDPEFVGCARSGEQPRSDGQSGLAVVGPLEAPELSLRRGRRVRSDASEPCLDRASELVEVI